MSLPAPWTVLFGAQSLTLPLPGSTAEAAERLRSIVQPSFLPVMGGPPGLVGRVSEERVTIRFRRRWFYNAIAPVFVGHFAVVVGRPSLEGAIRLSRSSQVEFGIVLAFLLLCTVMVVLALLLGLAEPGAEWGLPVLLFLWAAALGELYFSWWIGNRDRTEIEKGLREALSIRA